MADNDYNVEDQSNPSQEEETKPNRGKAEEEIISLLVEYPAHQYCKYNIKRSTKFEKLMKAFYNQNRLTSEGGLRFHYDGQRIQAGSLVHLFFNVKTKKMF
jgi:Ubiquitin-2 like Rad60 SUMO-like